MHVGIHNPEVGRSILESLPGCEFCHQECPHARAIKTSHPAESTGYPHHQGRA
jgi:hypothetical protein